MWLLVQAMVCTSATVMFYYSESRWCIQQRSAVPLIPNADVPTSPTDTSLPRFRFLLCAVWLSLQHRCGFTCPCYRWQQEKLNQSHIGSELVQWSLIHSDQGQRMTQKRDYDLSPGSPWVTIYSYFSQLLFQISITATLLQKKKTEKQSPRTAQSWQKWSRALFLGCVTLHTSWSCLIDSA